MTPRVPRELCAPKAKLGKLSAAWARDLLHGKRFNVQRRIDAKCLVAVVPIAFRASTPTFASNRVNVGTDPKF